MKNWQRVSRRRRKSCIAGSGSMAEGRSTERLECVLVAKARWRTSASAWKLTGDRL